jgi:hypothetical protein
MRNRKTAKPQMSFLMMVSSPLQKTKPSNLETPNPLPTAARAFTSLESVIPTTQSAAAHDCRFPQSPEQRAFVDPIHYSVLS